MKNENVVKSEVKSEAALQIEEDIDPSEYETQFEVMAMGIIADELP